MSELKINLLEFRKQMDLLEGIGLMKSFVKHDEQLSSFVYQLVQPPSMVVAPIDRQMKKVVHHALQRISLAQYLLANPFVFEILAN